MSVESMSVEEIKYKRYTIKVEQDDIPSNPRKEWDNLGSMVCFHGRYKLGDAHTLTLKQAQQLETSKDVISLPIYMYDHSGITINTTGFSCPWDSGKVGFIYVTKEKARKEYSWKVINKARREKLELYLKGEVEVYDQYLRGDCYGYQIFDPQGKDTNESCWGYFGSDYEVSGLVDAAQGAIDYYVERDEEIKLVVEASKVELPLLLNALKHPEAKEALNQRLAA